MSESGEKKQYTPFEWGMNVALGVMLTVVGSGMLIGFLYGLVYYSQPASHWR